jgi:hypothetical protein
MDRLLLDQLVMNQQGLNNRPTQHDIHGCCSDDILDKRLQEDGGWVIVS